MYKGKLLIYTSNKSDEDKDMHKVVARLNKMMNNIREIQLTKEEQQDFNALFKILDGDEFYYCASWPVICIDWETLKKFYRVLDFKGMIEGFKNDIASLMPLLK